MTLLTIGCLSESKPRDKNFAGSTPDERVKLFKQLGQELRGDFLTYSGQVLGDDTTGLRTLVAASTFIELVMDKDNRFSIRMRSVEKTIETDTMTIFIVGKQSNYGIGEWSDLGNKFQLQFQVGTVDSFFDNENNDGRLEVVDNYTLRFDKSTDKLWIWQTPCRVTE